MLPKVSYAHKNEPEGIRFVQYSDDPLPEWAINIVYENEEEDLTEEEN